MAVLNWNNFQPGVYLCKVLICVVRNEADELTGIKKAVTKGNSTIIFFRD